MNKIGPAIFIFAFAGVVAICAFPGYGALLFIIALAVVGLSSLLWGIYSLYLRRWSGLIFVALGVLELSFFLLPLSRRSAHVHAPTVQPQ